MSKWLPPLLCPIPRGHASHYEGSSSAKLASILKTFSSASKARLYRSLHPAKDIFPDLFDDDRLKQPSTYYRLFKRRTADKKEKHKKSKPQYIMFDPNGTFIRVDRTLKKAEYHLAQDESLYRNRYRKQPLRRQIPVGSFVLKIIEDPDFFNWGKPSIDDRAPVAVKRCKACPNKTSTQGMCHCGFWSAIRDSTHTKVWWPIHDRKMYDIRQSKEESKKLKIKVSLKSLFED